MTEPAKEKNEPVAVIHDWWSGLNAPTEPGQPSRRGELAQLRRCKTLEEVLFAPAYHALYHRAFAAGWGDRLRVAALAGLLAHLKGEIASPKSFAAFLATPSALGLGPRVSELRFQRLMKEKELAGFYPVLLRILHLAGDKAPVPDLIQGVYFWGDTKRRDWTFAYYNQLLDNEKP